MKIFNKISILVLVNLIIIQFTATAQSGWFWLQPLPQGNDLEAVQFTDANTVYACGAHGTIIKSADGGQSWSILNTGNEKRLYALSFIDNNIGYAAGYEGTLIKTSDGGETWQQIGNTEYDFKELVFLSENIGIALTWNKILKTTNGGESWEVKLNDEITWSLNFCDLQYGFAVTSSDTLLKTIDQGETWETIHCTSDMWISFCYFLSPEEGYVAGDEGLLSYTTNAGETWNDIYLPGGYELFDMSCSSAAFGYIIGYDWDNRINHIYKMSESPTDWLEVGSIEGGECWAVSNIDEQYATVVGELGTIIISTNSGGDWNSLNSAGQYNLYDLYFPSETVGYFVGRDGIILKTDDAGETVELLESGTTRDLMGTFFTNDNTGYIVGSHAILKKTTDGGLSWEDKNNGITGALYSLDFLSDNVGYAVGSLGIFKTNDGGDNWEHIYTPKGFTNMFFVDENVGFASNQYWLVSTTNGGTSWNEYYMGEIASLRGMYFFDALNGFISTAITTTEGGIYKTTDGGVTWERKNTSDNVRALGSIQFVNPDIGYVSGDDAFLKTINGGEDWYKLATPAKSIGNIFFTDTETGYAANYDGSILKTIDGGGTVTSIETENVIEPLHLYLSNNYPNPFSQNTTIGFKIDDPEFVSLKVYDVKGQEVEVLLDAEKPAGDYQLEFNASGLPTGIYYYRLTVGKYAQTKKIILMR